MAYSTNNTTTITASPNSNAANFFINQHPPLRYSSSESTVNVDSFYNNATNPPLFNIKSPSQVNDIQHQQQRRTSGSTNADPELNKYTGASLEEFQGKLFDLCKDQNGCRFLQTKLEESPMNVTIIYEEIHAHFVDLMTDPFGNYLCQKLLERCDDTQRTSIVDVIAPEFLKICLSMHGTRAVQKLIEFLSTKRQIQAVIAALRPNVVALIKDLNGNHVIQKCLHKLSSEHNQFIYDTVSEHCIQVASHKHGCCVYQRCIDHAVESQKIQLVNVITQHALPLVQDPFGNYVVQYVLGLEDATYYDNLIRRFIEPIRELSVQKFSSNVIEKCIRVAGKETRRHLIAGIIEHPNMERFLRDSYANYVIQTCLDCADEDQRIKFVECIRPLLPSIRNTPYGKRIYSKIHRDISNGPRSTASSSSTSRHLHYIHHQRSMINNSSTMNSSNIINGMNALHLNSNSASTSASNTTTTTATNNNANNAAIAYM
ncbi:armadillo-type protein [Parasitella parasitica]|nr:armadillo-type protein [Parasitella parasitica]